jgi:transmembrane 9 superfamily protein 3
MKYLSRVCASLALTIGGLSSVNADEYNHKYSKGDNVNFYVHKVGPYANPQEGYNYYSLPFCAPDNEHHPEKPNPAKNEGLFNKLRSNSIGEYLGGHALRHSGHSVQYAPDAAYTESCTKSSLTKEEADKFIKATKDQWLYQMYLDDLPVWGMVGEMYSKGEDTTKTPHVYTQRAVVVQYNKDRIIEVDLVSDPDSLVEIKPGVELKFQTKFVWEPSTKEFRSRFDKYLDKPFFKHHIHWFSLFNSFMMVLFLMGLVALILVRTLRKDYARYALSSGDIEEDAEYDEDGKPIETEGLVKGGNDDYGWKQVHGDVFRSPAMLTIFSATLGTGWQLIVLTLGVILFAVAGPIHGEVHEDRGEMQHAIIMCYCFSSIVSGYVSGSYFKLYNTTKSGGKKGSDSKWQVAMFLTVILFPLVVVGILSILNGIALVYGTVNYVPFLVIVKVFFIWIFVSVPLCIFGTLAGRHAKIGGVKGTAGCLSTTDFPCRVNAIARPIPEDAPWYGKPMNLIPFAGLLSFGSIFIELYYVLTSIWNYKIYHVYGFLLGVYGILAIVVSMTTIIVVYFCLNAENYLWQWTAFISGGSTAGYVFLYGIYYFMFKTAMTGFIQTMFYFGYMSLISLTLGMLCGTIAHFSANRFVRTIFQNVKLD